MKPNWPSAAKKVKCGVLCKNDRDLFNLAHFPVISGFHSLGFLETVRPDIHWIDFVRDYDWRIANPLDSPKTCQLLDQEISSNLTRGPVALLICDDDLGGPPWPNFAALCNRYEHEQFYLITHYPPQQQKMLTYQGGLTCKILEIPWATLNEIFGYYHACDQLQTTAPSTQAQYLCTINRAKPHKIQLLESLYKHGLGACGYITGDKNQLPNHLADMVSPNLLPPFMTGMDVANGWAGQLTVGDFLISGLTANHLLIESTYDMPLVIQPETWVGIFWPTEKSLWPALLGRMYLIYGQPGSMALIQRWHDVDQTEWCDITFDSMEGDWSDSANQARLDCMLETNRYLISHAREVYDEFRLQFQEARWKLGSKILAYVLEQLDRIPGKQLVDQ